MGRRRKKKSGNIKPGPAAENALPKHSVSHVTEPQKTEPAPDMRDISPSGKEKQAVPARTDRRGISALTCIAGMFLTLVLGIYLGTLLPGIINDLKKEDALPKSPPVAALPPVEHKQDNSGSISAQLQKHIDEMERQTSLEPASAPAWINLGNLYFDAGVPIKAITAYKNALRLAPDNADVLTDLGIMYRETGDFSRAVECFRKAIAVDPSHQNAMFNEGVVLAYDLKKPQEAASAWERLLGINPNAKSPAGAPLSEMIRKLRSQ